MAVHLHVPHDYDIPKVAGIALGYAQAGIKKPGRKDLLVIRLAEGCQVAGVFTKNRFCAAPVQVCRAHLASEAGIRALVINTGNANAGTGEQGLIDANQTCAALANLLNIDPEQVLPFSTGVILEPLPVDKVIAGLPMAIANLAEDNWFEAAHAIMTTDTLPKIAYKTVEMDGESITITGISKGAGMIKPNMATMLGFIGTDAKINLALLQELVKEVADQTFNRITVDGDTSTNDSFIVMASGQTDMDEIVDANSQEYQIFKDALLAVAQELAIKIVRDGEGATKLITVNVEGGRNEEEVLKVAYAIAHSPLIKTAFFASDPNLGRILAAIGYAGIDDLDVNQLTVHLDDVLVAEKGGRAASYVEAAGAAVMQQAEICVRVSLGRGSASTTVWTTDLSYDYVKINADYRS